MADLGDLRIRLEGNVERVEDATAQLEASRERLRKGDFEGLTKTVKRAASPEVEEARLVLKKRSETEPVLAPILARFHEAELALHRALTAVAEQQGKASFSALAMAERLEFDAPAPSSSAPRPVGPPPRFVPRVEVPPGASAPPRPSPPPTPRGPIRRASGPDEVLYDKSPSQALGPAAVGMLAPLLGFLFCFAVPSGRDFVGWVPLSLLFVAVIGVLAYSALRRPRVIVTGREVRLGNRVFVSTADAPLILEHAARLEPTEDGFVTVHEYTLRAGADAYRLHGGLPSALHEALRGMQHPPREVGFDD